MKDLMYGFNFQTNSVIVDDLMTLYSMKNLYLYTSLINLSSFILIIAFIIFLLNNRSFFLYLVAIELLLLSSIINFTCYLYFFDWLESEIIIFYILTIAVSESAFGLGLLINVFNTKGTINPSLMNDLN
jgi:NADH-quinone oxidoreductase subunit K